MTFLVASEVSRCTRQWVARGAALCLLALFNAPALAQDCVDDLTGVTNNCTANDVSLGLIFATEEQIIFCEAGEVIQVPLRASVVAGSQVRYDIGMFIAEDGGDARTGQCFHDFIRPVLGKTCGGPLDLGTVDAGGTCFQDQEVADSLDICGDVLAGEDNFYDLNGGDPVTLTCTPNPDDPTQVIVSHVVSWDNTSNNSCASIVDAVPNTKAKCSSGFSVVGGIQIIVEPNIAITKTADEDVINIGGTASYDIVVTNTTEPNGDTDLLNLVVTDDTCDAPPVLDGCTAGSPAALPAGESCTYTCSVTDAQVDFCNTATVVANPESAPAEEVTTQATECVDVVGGEIVVGKETLPDGATDIFEFRVVGPGFDNTGNEEDLQDDQTFSTGIIAPGEYTVTESDLPAGWVLTDVDCDVISQADGASRTFTLEASQTVTCTYTNTQDGRIEIEKQTAPNGSAQSFTFTGDVGGALSDGQNAGAGVAPGQYSSTETVPAGWELTSIVCDDANSSGNLPSATATFNVEPGETVRCVFTNTQNGSLTVEKECIGVSAGTFEFIASGSGLEDFALDCGGSRTFDNLLPGGGRSVAETVPADFALDASCDDASPTSNINVGAGESVTCTFTNLLVQDPEVIPVMDQRGLAVLALLLMGFAGWVLYRRRTSQLS